MFLLKEDKGREGNVGNVCVVCQGSETLMGRHEVVWSVVLPLLLLPVIYLSIILPALTNTNEEKSVCVCV